MRGPASVTTLQLAGFWCCGVGGGGWCLEPETGIEPATCCLQDSCSAELSYPGRIRREWATKANQNDGIQPT